mmetsp:Transcript_31145/g.70816  ORF Transcript_31145/g.70816 Transcript_31145/m.70816 type:complete len:363 (-) Transcript_31145:209-1297(-)
MASAGSKEPLSVAAMAEVEEPTSTPATPTSPTSPTFASEGEGLLDDGEPSAELEKFQKSGKLNQRRNSISAAPVSSDRIRDWKGPPVHEKSAEESKSIKETIKASAALQVLFGHLKGTAVDGVVGAMFLREVKVEEKIIEQGADGDYFYIVVSGSYDIFVQRRADVEPEKVMVATAGMSFGELALMYNVPRAATVICAEEGKLWCLEREVFQMMLVTAENSKKNEYEGFLRQVDLFSELNSYELSHLSDCLTSELFDDGEDIVVQGDEGDAVFFLYEGECKAWINGDKGEVEVKHYSVQGAYFGEIAIITSEPRRATVRACGEGCVALCLRREDVNMSIGSIGARLAENIEKYPQYEAYVKS